MNLVPIFIECWREGSLSYSRIRRATATVRCLCSPRIIEPVYGAHIIPQEADSDRRKARHGRHELLRLADARLENPARTSGASGKKDVEEHHREIGGFEATSPAERAE